MIIINNILKRRRNNTNQTIQSLNTFKKKKHPACDITMRRLSNFVHRKPRRTHANLRHSHVRLFSEEFQYLCVVNWSILMYFYWKSSRYCNIPVMYDENIRFWVWYIGKRVKVLWNVTVTSDMDKIQEEFKQLVQFHKLYLSIFLRASLSHSLLFLNHSKCQEFISRNHKMIKL